MATEKVTEYERKRLDNIRRNDETMSSLKLQSIKAQVSASTKRPSGVNFEDTSMIYHNNNTSRWISKFRGIWGWDDAYVFIGNVKRGVDVISPAARRTVRTLESPHMTAIPCRFDAHPYNVRMLAGSTAGGKLYVWTLG